MSSDITVKRTYMKQIHPGTQIIHIDVSGFEDNMPTIRLFTRDEYSNTWIEDNVHLWNVVGVKGKYHNLVTIARDTLKRHRVGEVLSEEKFCEDYFDLLLDPHDPVKFEYIQE